MSRFLASQIKLQAIKAGADFLSDDDTYMKINGVPATFDGGFGTVNGFTDHALFNTTRPFEREMRTGDSVRVDARGEFKNGQIIILNDGSIKTSTVGNGVTSVLPQGTATKTIPFFSQIKFEVFDKDTGIFEGGDDFIGSTTYVANGKEPLLGQGSFFFVNFMNGSGSQYKLEYNINKLPGSTNGKIATDEGGLLNGSNEDGTLVGKSGKDLINGNNGDDLIFGGANNDDLNGGNGDDLIFGGKGNDKLSGGNGSDTFVLARNNGLDIIKGFRIGEDSIGLGGDLKFEDLIFQKTVNGTSVKAGNEELALLQGVQPGLIGADSFSQINLGSLNSRVRADVAALA